MAVGHVFTAVGMNIAEWWGTLDPPLILTRSIRNAKEKSLTALEWFNESEPKLGRSRNLER